MNAQQLIDLEMSYEKASGLLAAAIAWGWSESDIDRQRELCKRLYRELSVAESLLETYHGLEYTFDYDGTGWYWSSEKDESCGNFRTLGEAKDDAENWLKCINRNRQEVEDGQELERRHVAAERLAYYQSRL